jgi:hypothetical protein
MTERYLPFSSATYVSAQSAESKFTSAAFRAIDFLFEGTLSAAQSGSPTLADEVPWSLIGPIELVVGGSTRFRVDSISLFHLSSILNGGYHHRDVPAATSASGFGSSFSLDFGRMMPGAGLDATGVDAFLRWEWRPATYYGSGGTGSYTVGSATAKPRATTILVKPPQGFREPEWLQVRHDIGSSSSAIDKVIDVKKAVELPGLLIEALDASGGGGTNTEIGVDGLIKNLTVEVNRPNLPTIKVYDNVSWRELRAATCRNSGLSSDDQTASAGVIWLPLFERKGGRNRDALHLPAGSSIRIVYDTSATVQPFYTGVTPASGDVARVLAPMFLAVPEQAAAAAATVNDRNALRRARRAGVAPRRVRNAAGV